MITVMDTLRAVSELAEGLFGEAPVSQDIHEGFIRPCTYVQAVELRRSPAGELLRHDVYGLELIRLARRSHAGYLELLEYQERLRLALEAPIPVAEAFFLYPEDVSFRLDREDMALVASFTVENVQRREDADAHPPMEELELEMQKGE